MTGVIRDLWATKEPRTTVVVADSSFSEACKWKGIELDEEGPVFSLSPEQNVLDAITSEKAERVLFLLSSLSSETLASAKKIIIASQAPECCVLTSVAPWSVSMHRQSHDSTTQKSTQEDLSYEFIESLLFPAQTVVRYVPCHSIDLISGKV